MDLYRLELFLNVVEAGSVSAAAARVHLAQPTLSRNMQMLEELIGTRLFVRSGRALMLTAAGRALVPKARDLVKQARLVVDEVSDAAERDYYDVKLGAIASVATYLFPKLYPTLRKAFPKLAIKLRTARSSDLVQETQIGELDLCVIASSGPPPGIESTKVNPYRLQYYGRKDIFPAIRRATTEAEVREFPVVELAPSLGSGGSVGGPKGALPYAAANDIATVKALVLAGFGVGDLLDFMLSPTERSKLARARVPHDPSCALYVVRSPMWRSKAEPEITSTLARELRKGLTC